MKQFGPMLIVWGAAMATLLLTRELGTSLMFYGAFLALLYVATGRFSFPFIGLAAVRGRRLVRGGRTSATSTRACSPGSTRSTRRSTTSVGGSYQLAQSLFAQADGGLLGTGLRPVAAAPAARRARSCRCPKAT